MKLNIVLGNKSEKNQGVYFFQEILYPLYHMLLENNYECTIIDKACSVNTKIENICIGIFNCVHLQNMPKKYIMYAIEPVENLNDIYIKQMQNALYVLHIYPPTYTQLYTYNKNNIYLPLLYHPSLINMYNINTNNILQDIDVLFYGTLNNRRINIINMIKTAGINIYCPNLNNPNGCFGKDKDLLIQRSKIILLTNYFNNNCDMVRSIYLMSNKKMIISDDYGGANELKEIFNNIFPVVSTDKLIETIQYYLNNQNLISEIENKSHKYVMENKHINNSRDEIINMLTLIN